MRPPCRTRVVLALACLLAGGQWASAQYAPYTNRPQVNPYLNLFRGGLVLQGRYQTQHDNLRDQKLFTTNRDLITGAAVGRLNNGVTLTLVGLLNRGINDAQNDTLLVDNRSTAINSAIGIPWRLARRVLAQRARASRSSSSS